MKLNDGACWVRAHTFVIDDGVTSIGNAFDRGSARLGKITFLRTLTRRETQTGERPKTLLTKLPDRSHKIDSPLENTKTLTMALLQKTKKGDQRGLETADRQRKGVPGSVPDKITVPDNSAW